MMIFASPIPIMGEANLDKGVKDFREKMNLILSDKCLSNGKTSIKIISLYHGDILYEYNSNDLLIPASNVKLVTTAAALLNLHPNYRFKTTLSTDGSINDNVLKGNLYIKGFGDPMLVSEELWMMVKDLHNLGIRSITGDIIADDTFFDSERVGNGWGRNIGSQAYCARIGALSFNFNTITVYVEPGKEEGKSPIVVLDPLTRFISVDNKAITISQKKKNRLIVDRVEGDKMDKIIISGKIAKGKERNRFYLNISNPPLYTASGFRDLLSREGIEVKGEIIIGRQPSGVKELVVHYSKSLSSIIQGLNKLSNNFIAEQILKTMGAEIKGEHGTEENGLKIVYDFMEKVGIDNGTYTIVDGSGLSEKNRLSADQFLKVLIYMYNDFTLQPEYLSSLSVMGVDGSLNGRLNNTHAERKIRSKTGTLNGVNALSGYAKTRDDEIIAFSILMNYKGCDHGKIKAIQNKIALLMVDFSRGDGVLMGIFRGKGTR
ncbi:MAG: D-alanyl-D-alanine carboxypeptidase/D-alanyl-D-alanine-endopeptidase [Nitrospinae bacterium]|nr:D-alanyl-D-alanine carboxypeptidase/D-alanyl-D-alanine-endopeptidase [Nitrospinota bacterium]